MQPKAAPGKVWLVELTGRPGQVGVQQQGLVAWPGAVLSSSQDSKSDSLRSYPIDPVSHAPVDLVSHFPEFGQAFSL
jgi:hypothetical protein